MVSSHRAGFIRSPEAPPLKRNWNKAVVSFLIALMGAVAINNVVDINRDDHSLTPEEVAAKLGPKIIEIFHKPAYKLNGKVLFKATAGPTPENPDAPQQMYLLIKAPNGEEEYILTVISPSGGPPSGVSIKAAPLGSESAQFSTDTSGQVIKGKALNPSDVASANTLLNSLGAGN